MNTEQALDYIENEYGRRICRITLGRWINHGLNGTFLKVRRLGRQIIVTPEAIEEFIDGCTKQKSHQPIKTAAQRRRANKAARKELEKAGFFK